MAKNLEDDCNNPKKHPIDFMGLTPKEFTAKYKLWEKNYKAEFFSGLDSVYKIQSNGDRERGRIKLASALEQMSTSCYLLSKDMNYKEHKHKESSIEMTAEQSSVKFGKTNYFFQKMCLELMGEDAPKKSFDSVIKSINEVCKTCKSHMKDPFREQYF